MKKINFSHVDLARVSLTMEGPQLVNTLLQAGEDYADNDLDFLATLLSEGSPDETMLVLACSASHLSNFGKLDPAMQLSLRVIAGNILEDYASVVFTSAQKPSIIDCGEQLDVMQEDFEMFSEIFAIIADMSAPHTAQHHVCLILADQALAQAEAIDYVDNDFCDEADILPEVAQVVYSDNIIPFPVMHRRY